MISNTPVVAQPYAADTLSPGMGARRAIGWLVLLVGILALIAGVIYLTVQGKSLPSFLGQLHGYTGHRSKRGIAALIAGGVLVVAGGWIIAHRPRTAS